MSTLELYDVTGHAWINETTGEVIMWNKNTRNFKFANSVGQVPVRMEETPWNRGAATVDMARKLAEEWFNREEKE